MSFTMDRYSKVRRIFDLPMWINIILFFVYDCLFTNSFRENSKKEQKDDKYTEFNRELSELQQRALFAIRR